MPKTPDARPQIATLTTSKELRRWYWRKDELTAYAREIGVKTTSGKFVILDRIAHFLDTGEVAFPGDKATKVTSKFDWHTAPLCLNTIITDSYKNTQNVRRFFRDAAGADFKFNIAFMEWMKANEGKTLADAVAAYHEIKGHAADKDHRTQIKAHNQFNQYARDFLDDNPALGMEDVRRVWALKIALPSETGRHVYDPADLAL